MDVNEYVLETLVRERLKEARAMRARHRLDASRGRRSRPAFRVRVGAVLIALGERLADAPAPRGTCATGASHG
jgi:hypothetical protein